VLGHSRFHLVEAYILALRQEDFANQPPIRPFVRALKSNRLVRDQLAQVLHGLRSEGLRALRRVDSRETHTLHEGIRGQCHVDRIAIDHANDLANVFIGR
jgi:hypothetical protein